MSELLKINACVYSRKGYERDSNRDDFYMNGKFLSEHHLDNMEASMENRGNEYFFAVADHMEFSDEEQKANFSILRELGKFHEKITVHDGDLGFKTKELTARVTETGKYLESFLDIKKVPADDPARAMGFAGLLMSDGKAVAATYGTGHVYLCRGEVFKHLTADHANPQRLVELGIISDEEAEDFEDKYHSADKVEETPVSLSEPFELMEGDKFLIISDGVYNALEAEHLEDILSMRSDSTYLAYRVISEAMKTNYSDDMTAMVVRIERITSSTGVVRKAPERPKASALKSTPQPTYKYHKKNFRKYENIIYYVAVFLTAILLILIIYLVISNIYKNLTDPADVKPKPTISASISPSPTPEVTPEATPAVTPEATPEPTKAPVAVEEYTVVKGDSLTRIVKQKYGTEDPSFVEKFGAYNKLTPPYNILIGQKLKIPPKEDILNMQ